jgi:hypothetical protein
MTVTQSTRLITWVTIIISLLVLGLIWFQV